MTEQEKQERIALLEAQMAFMQFHEHADSLAFDESGVLISVTYLAPMEKAKHPEKYSPLAWLQKYS